MKKGRKVLGGGSSVSAIIPSTVGMSGSEKYALAFKVFMDSDLPAYEVALRLDMHAPTLTQYAIKQGWETLRARQRVASSLVSPDRLDAARQADQAVVHYATQAIHTVMPAYLQLVQEVISDRTGLVADEILQKLAEDREKKPEQVGKDGKTILGGKDDKEGRDPVKAKRIRGPIGRIEALNAVTDGMVEFVRGMKDIGLVLAPAKTQAATGSSASSEGSPESPIPTTVLNQINIALQQVQKPEKVVDVVNK